MHRRGNATGQCFLTASSTIKLPLKDRTRNFPNLIFQGFFQNVCSNEQNIEEKKMGIVACLVKSLYGK